MTEILPFLLLACVLISKTADAFTFTKPSSLRTRTLQQNNNINGCSNSVATFRHDKRAGKNLFLAFRNFNDMLNSENDDKTNYGIGLPTAAAAAVVLSVALFVAPTPPAAYAVSGGGSDFAGQDLSNQDFSNGKYANKDFTGILGRNTNFSKSNLFGARFQNGYLIDANFADADLTGVSFERTNMENVNMKNAIAKGGYFDQNLLEAKNLENVDFTDATIPPKILGSLCERPDMKGTNPTTGADTRDSVPCL